MHDATRPNRKHRTVVTGFHMATAIAIAMIGGLLGAAFFAEIRGIDAARENELRAITNAAIAIAASYDDAGRSGIMTPDQAQKAAFIAITAIRQPDKDPIVITDASGLPIPDPTDYIAAMPETPAPPNPLLATLASLASLARDRKDATHAYEAARPDGTGNAPKLAVVSRFTPWGWVISTAAGTADLAAARWRIGLVLMLAGAWSMLAVGLVVQSVGRRLSLRMHGLSQAAERLAQGDLTVQFEGAGERDELGVLAHALDTLRRHALDRGRIVRVGLEERAAKERRQAAMDRLTRDFSTAMSGVLTRLTQTTADMARAQTGAVDTPIQIDEGGGNVVALAALKPVVALAALKPVVGPAAAKSNAEGASRRKEAERDDDTLLEATTIPNPIPNPIPSAGDIAAIVASLRDEVDQFVHTMTRGDEFRRRYERVSGEDTEVTLIMPQGAETSAMLSDISRGGAALRSGMEGEVGSQVMLTLPGLTDPVAARIVRHAAGIIAVAFRQDDHTLSQVDLAIASIGRDSGQLRAA